MYLPLIPLYLICSSSAGLCGESCGQTTSGKALGAEGRAETAPSGEPKCPKCKRRCPCSHLFRKAYLTQLRAEKAGSGVSPLDSCRHYPPRPCRPVVLWAEAQGVEWSWHGNLARWKLCLGCHKKKWPEAGWGWVIGGKCTYAMHLCTYVPPMYFFINVLMYQCIRLCAYIYRYNICLHVSIYILT